MSTEVTPPPVEPDLYYAFRSMTSDELVNLLCSQYGYNRYSLTDEYREDHKETVRWINRSLQPVSI